MTNVPYEGTDILELLTEAKNYNASITREILKEIGSEKTCVDFGAGIGTYAEILKKHGLSIICIDRDENHQKILSSKGFETFLTLQMIVTPPPFLYSLNVLEHVENDLDVLKEIFNCLPKSSKIFIYVPALNWLWTDLDDQVGHYRRYNRKLLKKVLEDAGFTINKIQYCDFAGLIVTLVFKFLHRSSKSLKRSDILFYDRFVFYLSRCFDPLFRKIAGKNIMAVATKK